MSLDATSPPLTRDAKDSHDERCTARHAPAAIGTHRQHQFADGPDSLALHGAVRIQQARGGRVLAVAGSRGQEVRDQGPSRRTGLPPHNFESNALAADRKSEPYGPARANAEAVPRNEVTKADSPEVVAATVVTAASAATPRLRYTAGRDAAMVSLLRRFTPASAFDQSLRRRMQMPA